MISELLQKLFFSGILARGIWETVYMTVIATLISYAIGLPLGIVLYATDKGGIHPIGWLNRLVGVIVNVFRSIPFVILMVAMLPLAKRVVGTAMGNKAMIFTLIIAAAPYVARMTQSSFQEVGTGVIEAAQAMGASAMQMVCKVLIPEAKPSLIAGSVISMVTILGYSA
ncbi:MAG: ABC transporter permease, partial [Oscillospiraceae bacterium]|nr:ABC transporter permease [Oscillospiraceae bacterium]